MRGSPLPVNGLLLVLIFVLFSFNIRYGTVLYGSNETLRQATTDNHPQEFPTATRDGEI